MSDPNSPTSPPPPPPPLPMEVLLGQDVITRLRASWPEGRPFWPLNQFLRKALVISLVRIISQFNGTLSLYGAYRITALSEKEAYSVASSTYSVASAASSGMDDRFEILLIYCREICERATARASDSVAASSERISSAVSGLIKRGLLLLVLFLVLLGLKNRQSH